MKKILFIGRTIAMCFALGLSGIGRARADESLYQPYDPDADDTVVVQSGVYGEYDPTDTVGEPTQLIPVAVPAPAAKPAVARMAKLPEPVRYRVAHINRAPYPHGTVVAQGVFAGKPINATARVPSPASLGVGDPRAPRAAARPATKQPIKKPVVVQPVEKPVPAQPDSILPPPKENMNVSVAAVAASTFAN
ncbi:MAG: hypothetical protein FWC51_00695, partial [Proteobacteria bacterium]|nr:hypothetical protein [Pseudomonadota bacterium]